MNSKIVGLTVLILAVLVIIGFFGLTSKEKKTNAVFHVTLADSKMYKKGVFTDSFKIEKGHYFFSFVPNGDSPKKITIFLDGTNYHFMEKFELKGKLQNSGISEYYTWRYVGGNTEIEIPSTQEIKITIDPHGNYEGPFSVFLKSKP